MLLIKWTSCPIIDSRNVNVNDWIQRSHLHLNLTKIVVFLCWCLLIVLPPRYWKGRSPRSCEVTWSEYKEPPLLILVLVGVWFGVSWQGLVGARLRQTCGTTMPVVIVWESWWRSCLNPIQAWSLVHDRGPGGVVHTPVLYLPRWIPACLGCCPQKS